MGKTPERKIILKTDKRTIFLEMAWAENSKRDQADGTRTEPFSKATFTLAWLSRSLPRSPRSRQAASPGPHWSAIPQRP